VEITPRDRGFATPANDNAKPTARRLARVLGPALLLVLAASGWVYLYYLT
jgi:hypothetical protein